MEGMVWDGFSFEGKWGSRSWVAMGRVTDHRGYFGLERLPLISGVVVVQDRHYQSLWSLLTGGVAGWGWSLLVTMSLCPGTFSEASDFDMAVKAPPMEDCQVPLARRAGRLIPLSR